MRKFIDSLGLRGRWRLMAGVAVALLASACTSAPRYRSSVPPDGRAPAVAPVGADRQEIVRYARTFLGTPYRNGGTTRKGVDCSGLVIAVYRAFDIRLPRRSLDQSRIGVEVPASRIRPGDLVFFKTSPAPVSHVGIYLGGGDFIHASTSARQVRIDTMSNVYFKHRFVAAKRLLDG